MAARAPLDGEDREWLDELLDAGLGTSDKAGFVASLRSELRAAEALKDYAPVDAPATEAA